MASYTFIAGHKDHNCILTNVNDDITTLEELKETIKSDAEEAYELFGNRWRVDYEDVYVDDLCFLSGEELDDVTEDDHLTDDDFEEISNDILLEVEKEWIITNV